jgi:hypothetical protein
VTDYIILKKNGAGPDASWNPLPGTYNGASGRGAVLAALRTKKEHAEGEFVAVPARSWQPVKVQVETALKFS